MPLLYLKPTSKIPKRQQRHPVWEAWHIWSIYRAYGVKLSPKLHDYLDHRRAATRVGTRSSRRRSKIESTGGGPPFPRRSTSAVKHQSAALPRTPNPSTKPLYRSPSFSSSAALNSSYTAASTGKRFLPTSSKPTSYRAPKMPRNCSASWMVSSHPDHRTRHRVRGISTVRAYSNTRWA